MSQSQSSLDLRFMAAVERYARRGLGEVWPNPPVGALVVSRNEAGAEIVVGRGRTSKPGGPHAEVHALRMAGEQAKGATCYVTLEPCSHYGRTPPCAVALVEAGVKRVVIGMRDPNPRVAGRGIKMLEEAGLEVTVGVHEAACQELYSGFTMRITRHRPKVLLKIAVSKDGFIGREGAGQVLISNPLSMRHVHGFRSTYDAIMVGIGTALADDPMLNCRLPGMAGRSPVRVIIDSKARLPLNSKLVQSVAEVPVWVICANTAPAARVDALAKAGVHVIRVPVGNEGIEPSVIVSALSTRGITRLMVEGGARIATAFLKAELIDDMCIVTGDVEVGEGGIPVLNGLNLEDVIADPKFAKIEAGVIGSDNFIYLRRTGA
ncbi:bifunctional diaminohydroxyphosphoribosylaminopyrimidine deaminase/5-amino-6-(5-phosphoribosylamino)uracil reductase RibD [Roseibium sediminis]|uniref:bifunctional diaminohydroxyphosphoribosylaminopyrimidine deaminase/5-amino-6-(5-phosphoribosylamino)uracil reductase RibD n=1 Tax=Roseibium sediminis TaxID=1775174 RepID=UPI00123DD69A|nr:bifunctional diaminohydroxyphosphoribosylaminopyrimidine deaminase/5-amino-6-(5-phosphoribosylamino)uracil reductase RibD [Roseibium sediminis]